MISEVPSLPVEEIVHFPLPGMAHPASLAFSPDDRLVTYLYSPDGNLTRLLYAFDPETGEHSQPVSPPGEGTTEGNISLAEALRRERQRQREVGITHYAWARHVSRVLIPVKGDVYVQDGFGMAMRKIVDGQEYPAIDPQFSPDGNWVAYVQDAELYVVPFASGPARQLTSGARSAEKTNGLAEYIAQEEMARSHGFWWSPDSQLIAFAEVDEAHIPVYRIAHQGKDTTRAGAQEDHHYPFAGGDNAHVRLGVISQAGGEPTWMDLGNQEIYLARVDWLPDGRLCAQLENRSQTQLDLVEFDLATGRRRLLLRETSPLWINLHNLFRPLMNTEGETAGGFIWASEQSGFRHLYLHDREGRLIRPLTHGEWQVDDIAAIDERSRQVYFTATRSSPLESHLYAVSFSGGEPRQITHAPGMHTVVCDHAARRFIDTYHAIDQPPVVSLCSLVDGARLCTLYDQVDPRLERLGLRPPELVELHNRTGDLLYGAIYRPPAAYGSGPYPTIVYTYGGPHVQLVTNGWGLAVAMRAQYLRSLGFLVFVLDNRGSARRGLAFESVLKNNLGSAEVDDQVDGVRWLVGQGLADPERVGIYGWSYGGYMAALCLARAPEIFQVAVAGAPVTDWDGYDTHYTERYMSTPQSNPHGYARSSVMAHVANLRGKLMLVHGLIDENVHFRHTARLINALIQARKPYDLLLFPDERHMPRRPADRVYMEELISAYFLMHIGK